MLKILTPPRINVVFYRELYCVVPVSAQQNTDCTYKPSKSNEYVGKEEAKREKKLLIEVIIHT